MIICYCQSSRFFSGARPVEGFVPTRLKKPPGGRFHCGCETPVGFPLSGDFALIFPKADSKPREVCGA